MESRLDGPQRPAQGVRDLSIAQPFHFSQQHHGPIVGPEPRERPRDLQTPVEARSGLRLIVLAELDFAPARPVSNLVLGSVDGDAEEPASKRPFSAKASRLAIGREERVLGDVFREGSIPENPESEVPKPSLVAEDEALERRLVPLEKSREIPAILVVHGRTSIPRRPFPESLICVAMPEHLPLPSRSAEVPGLSDHPLKKETLSKGVLFRDFPTSGKFFVNP